MNTAHFTARRKRAAFVRRRLLEQAELAQGAGNMTLAWRYLTAAERMTGIFVQFLRDEETSMFGAL